MSPSHKNKKVILILLTASLVILAAAAIKIIALDQVKSVVTVEAGDRFPDISSFLRHENAKGSFMTDITKIDMNVTGVYDIEIRSGNRTYISKLEVVDTTAPKASVRELETWVGERKSAIDFVDKVIDISTVDVYYRQEPDFEQVGVQNVYIVLEDQSGNKSEFKTRLTVKADEEPPVIEGVTDHTVYIGETIAYRKGITVTDNRDENVDFTVDSSSVNLRKEGQYVVIYTAVDSSGNKAEVKATVNVIPKPESLIAEEKLYELADQVLAEIITDDMTDIDKLWAIYKWTRLHIKYTGDSDKTNWVKEATRGIQKATGDCFTYYATSQALLTRAGFENMPVFRDREDDYHVWNLVKYNGNWYHFDTTPSRTGYFYVCFLRTDAEEEEYSKWCVDYHSFDKSKYPRTGTEPIKHHRNLWG